MRCHRDASPAATAREKRELWEGAASTGGAAAAALRFRSAFSTKALDSVGGRQSLLLACREGRQRGLGLQRVPGRREIGGCDAAAARLVILTFLGRADGRSR